MRARFRILQALAPAAEWQLVKNNAEFAGAKANAFFDLLPERGKNIYRDIEVPVFVNSMTIPLTEMNAPKNIIRLNSWPGFIEKNIWEIAGEVNENAGTVLQTLNKKYIRVNDEPGFISPRIIAMIINEAYFAKGDKVSTETDIDTAMKLGTNYPYGPFEWCKLIGTENVFALLKKLAEKDERYMPSPALEKEIISRA